MEDPDPDARKPPKRTESALVRIRDASPFLRQVGFRITRFEALPGVHPRSGLRGHLRKPLWPLPAEAAIAERILY